MGEREEGKTEVAPRPLILPPASSPFPPSSSLYATWCSVVGNGGTGPNQELLGVSEIHVSGENNLSITIKIKENKL